MPQRDYGERELELLRQVLESKQLGAISGAFTSRFEDQFARAMGTRYAVAMNSAMSVLHASAISAGAGPGSEVVCDAVFVFGALATLYSGALPRFVDVDPVSHNLDANKLEEAINERTRAVIVTHAWGLPAEMDRIVEIAHKHNLVVIEDCAHAILATYKDKSTGSWGDIGSFSFQASKQMSLGDGGMATTDDEQLAEQLDLHAGAPTFHSVAHGVHYNYRMNEQTSAIGIAQLEKLPRFIEGLKRNGSYYTEAISDCPWLGVQEQPEAQSSYHYWAATFNGEEHGIDLSAFKTAVKEGSVPVSVGYTQMPVYRHPVVRNRVAHAFHCSDNAQIEYPDGLCPVAERIIPRMVLAGTVTTRQQAEENAEKLHGVTRRLGG